MRYSWRLLEETAYRRRSVHRLLQRRGLTLPVDAALALARWVDEGGELTTVSALACFGAGVNPSYWARRLMEAGLVAHVPVEDKRVTALVPTEAGRKLAHDVLELLEALDQASRRGRGDGGAGEPLQEARSRV